MKWRRAVLPRARTGSVAITSPLQTSMEGAFLGLFPGPVVECNVEPAVTEDADPLYGSIPGAWYRGTGRGRVKGILRAREKSCILCKTACWKGLKTRTAAQQDPRIAHRACSCEL